MTNGTKKLKKDLDILIAMVEELTNYIYSEALYWPMFKAGYPQMSLGGLLMRKRRLQILAYLLSESEQVKLKQIVIQFEEMTYDKPALLEKKGTLELNTRITQWKEHLQEYWDSEMIEQHYYATDVEVRTIITDLVSMLDSDSYQFDVDLVRQVDSLDDDLLANWQDGKFIWPPEWIPAYGKGDYWWLYGMPDVHEK
jgi:hypothetical protein